ncbi:MAG: XRE family transcriptional regulator [Bacteroidia bacterium]
MKKRIKFVVEKTDSGFSAFAEDSPIFTTGKNISELQKNIIEALELSSDADNRKINTSSFELVFDLKQFFKYYRVINSKYLAERIGMNPSLFSQYIQGKKKPSSSQTSRILAGIHEIGKELSSLNLSN